MCEAWASSFEAFIRDVGRRPSPDHSIDRRDNDGDYEPGNVRWATDKQQMRNTRLTARFMSRGATKNVADAADAIGISRSAMRKRLEKWDPERAEIQPVSMRHRANSLCQMRSRSAATRKR